MKTYLKVLYSGLFSLSTLCLCIGYAAESQNLKFNGTVDANMPSGVFITSASIDSTNTTSGSTVTINSYTKSLLNSSITLTSSTSSKASYNVTVYNIENETYAFSAVKYGEEFYDNTGITFTLNGLERKDEIASKSYLTFQVIFSFKNGVISNTMLNSVLDFEFVPVTELPKDESEIAVKGVLGRFKEILDSNNDHTTLTDQMDKNSTNDRYNSSYIGNVVGSSEADQEVLAELFIGNLYLNINGVDTTVTIMIKRENLDNNVNTGDENGNEMTIYMTTDNLERDSFWSAGTAPVYAGVYTKKVGSNEWSQIGPLFVGTATVKGYDGNIFGEGSFDTDTWKSTNANGQTANRTIEQIIANYI